MSRRRRYELPEGELNQQIDALIERAQQVYAAEAPDSVRQIIASALRLVRDGSRAGDLKLINNALKELRHAFRVFAPYTGHRKVAVFGSARTRAGTPEWEHAWEFAERIVAEGWMVITGAGLGIMGAAQGGAGREASFGVNIRLPFEQSANEVIAGDSKLINFRYFFTRKVIFVKEAHGFALFPGGFGTHDEGFEALTLIQTGKAGLMPVVFVDVPGGSYWRDWDEYVRSHLHARGLISDQDLALFKVTDDLDEAIEELTGFYANYHSSRFVGQLLVLRVVRAPAPEQLDALNVEFADIVAAGKIELRRALPQEADDAPSLPRIAFRFNRRDYGRLRQLVDRLNAFSPLRPSPLGASPQEIVPQPLSREAERDEQDDA